jgi:Cu(I)/Ag(I) efflux system periplasmic protein CusF
MQRLAFALATTLAFVSPLALACDDHAPGKEPMRRAVSQRLALASGEVRELDPEERTITLSHGRIASLKMAPMTSMVFKASELVELAKLKPGDKVRFRATIVGERPTVTEIRFAAR